MKSCEGCYYYTSVSTQDYENIPVCKMDNTECDGSGCDAYTTAEDILDELKPKYRKLKSCIHSIKCIAHEQIDLMVKDDRYINVFGDILKKIEEV